MLLFTKSIILILLFASSTFVHGQNVYKTPSGKKYHLNNCRMVENVSKKLVGESDVTKYRLEPCKICKPPIKKSIVKDQSNQNKAVGESTSVQCKGYTQQRTRCKHKTSLANGYCYQHTSQNSYSNTHNLYNNPTTTSICGAKTKSGGYCKRKVKGSGHCYQHK